MLQVKIIQCSTNLFKTRFVKRKDKVIGYKNIEQEGKESWIIQSWMNPVLLEKFIREDPRVTKGWFSRMIKRII